MPASRSKFGKNCALKMRGFGETIDLKIHHSIVVPTVAARSSEEATPLARLVADVASRPLRSSVNPLTRGASAPKFRSCFFTDHRLSIIDTTPKATGITMSLSDALSGFSTVKLSTSDLIAEQLRRAILLGTIAGGDQLKQNDVAARFGVSVAPVREALQRLIADGLAVLHPNRGVAVAPVSEHDFLEIAELRNLLEPHALRLSAPRLTATDLKYSERVLTKTAHLADRLDCANLHWEFHRSLYKRAQRPRLLTQIGCLYQGINRYLLPTWAKSGLSSDWVESHLRILAKIRQGNIEGACCLIVDQTKASTKRVQAHLHQEAYSTEDK